MSIQELTLLRMADIPTTDFPGYITALGAKVSIITSYEECYALLSAAALRSAANAYITVNNAHTLVEGARRPEFRNIINESALSLADGRPLSIIGRFKGARHMHRIFGPTLLEKVLEWGQTEGLRHFFFGNTPQTLDKMARAIAERYPGAMIAGMISPPFLPFSDAENAAFLAEIRKAKPDIIWVSLGAPKQEEWIYQHYRELDRGLFIGIGAGFSYLAGTIKHAPAWMKHLSLEWLYRLFQEPNRLFRRYMVNNTLFIIYIIKELLTGRVRSQRVR